MTDTRWLFSPTRMTHLFPSMSFRSNWTRSFVVWTFSPTIHPADGLPIARDSKPQWNRMKGSRSCSARDLKVNFQGWHQLSGDDTSTIDICMHFLFQTWPEGTENAALSITGNILLHISRFPILQSFSICRENPAQTHRLIPWLNRELVVLMPPNNTNAIPQILEEMRENLCIHDIQSRETREYFLRYLHNRTDHFIHEFYNFGISPYDIVSWYWCCT